MCIRISERPSHTVYRANTQAPVREAQSGKLHFTPRSAARKGTSSALAVSGFEALEWNISFRTSTSSGMKLLSPAASTHTSPTLTYTDWSVGILPSQLAIFGFLSSAKASLGKGHASRGTRKGRWRLNLRPATKLDRGWSSKPCRRRRSSKGRLTSTALLTTSTIALKEFEHRTALLLLLQRGTAAEI